MVAWSDPTGASGYERQEHENPGFDSPVSYYHSRVTQ